MIHLVTGGSGSGKSAYAEQCILDFGGTRRVYIATMQPFGAEGQARIARHRKMRAAKQFSTIECYTNLKEVELEPGSDVLLECMSNLTANEIFDPSGAGKARAEEEILAGVSRLAHQARNLVLVLISGLGSRHLRTRLYHANDGNVKLIPHCIQVIKFVTNDKYRFFIDRPL